LLVHIQLLNSLFNSFDKGRKAAKLEEKIDPLARAHFCEPGGRLTENIFIESVFLLICRLVRRDKMKKLLLNAAIALILFGYGFECRAESAAKTVDKKVEVANAKAAIKALASSLQVELQRAMQEGGPVAAISACNIMALPITKRVSEEHGFEVSRVSLKNRNPINAPNSWQKKVLESFEAWKSRGDDAAALSWAEVVAQDSYKQFRFMKAIPTGKVCLKCHGTEIAPEVKKKLADLYPEDRATGFNPGDIRGAFVVTKDFLP